MTHQEIVTKFIALLAVAKNQGYDVDDLKMTTERKLKGNTLGCIQPSKWLISFDLHYAAQLGDAYTQTIAHEIAHGIVLRYYPNAKQHHGKEFRMVMNRVFGMDGRATQCHTNIEMKPKRAVTKTRHLYTCKCDRDIKLTTTQHEKNLRHVTAIGVSLYRCQDCNTRLINKHEVLKFI